MNGFGRDSGIVQEIQLHILLGLYSMSMNCMDLAETQVLFKRFSCTLFWVFTRLNDTNKPFLSEEWVPTAHRPLLPTPYST